MGERANVVIQSYNESRTYLYSHWDGEGVLAPAIKGLKSGRVGDPQYLARIVFENMILEDIGSETGYGISAALADNSYPLLVIDAGVTPTTVHFETEAGQQLTKKIPAPEFVTAVEEIESWRDRAKQGDIYDELIAKIGT